MSLKRTTASLTAQGNQQMAGGNYVYAEQFFERALKEWRGGGGAKADEGELITQLGKAYEAQRKYEPAYELYMQALNYLTGAAYDEVYSNFLYLNEKMGSFSKKEPF